MKANYKIENSYCNDMEELIVTNWHVLNKICNWQWFGCATKDFSENAIGKWIIKYKEQ